MEVLNTTAAAKAQQENTGTVQEEPKYKTANVFIALHCGVIIQCLYLLSYPKILIPLVVPQLVNCVVYVLFVSSVLFYVLFVCKCVLYYCHRVLTQLQLTNISSHIIWFHSKRALLWQLTVTGN